MAGSQNSRIQLIVDCQVLQTSDRQRGMGFYLKSLLAAARTVDSATDIEWVFVVNPRLPKLNKEDQILLDTFGGKYLEVKLLHQEDSAVFGGAAAENKRLLDKSLEPLLADTSFEKTIFFIPAMYSRSIYPVFPSSGTANLMLFYDVIPFLYHQQYFRDHEGTERKDYSQRFREFYKTDLFVAISQTTADDLTVYFGVEPKRIVSILGAAADRSDSKPSRPKIASKLDSGFVLMPSGDDFRKNNEAAVRAFAALNAKEKLVVTSTFSSESQANLKELSSNIIFAGSVPDSEYLWLMDHAKAVLFPTLYEGLGMPALEAVERGAKVACSNIPVFAEISQTAFFGFNPESVSSITQTLSEILQPDATHETSWAKKQGQYSAILAKFSWTSTAELFVQALNACEASGSKPRLAVFCPSPSSYSAIGKYVFELHAELSRHYDVDYYAESGETNFSPTRPNILEYAANYSPAFTFDVDRAKEYDHVLYHIGNSEFHTESILNALRLPGLAVVHDTRLQGIFDYMVNRRIMSDERRNYEQWLDQLFGAKDTNFLTSIVTNQRIVFCHSNFAKRAISSLVVDEKPQVMLANLPTGVPSIQLMSSSKPVISFAGIISEDKGIGLVAEVSRIKDVEVKIFGFGVLGDSPLLQTIGTNVEVKRDLTDKEFQDTLRQSNILINYRINYHGETSLSTLEAMRYGAVVIVRDVGWFGELPDNVVVKVKSEAEVLDAVKALVADPEKVRSIGAAARDYLSQHYSHSNYTLRIKEGVES